MSSYPGRCDLAVDARAWQKPVRVGCGSSCLSSQHSGVGGRRTLSLRPAWVAEWAQGQLDYPARPLKQRNKDNWPYEIGIRDIFSLTVTLQVYIIYLSTSNTYSDLSCICVWILLFGYLTVWHLPRLGIEFCCYHQQAEQLDTNGLASLGFFSPYLWCLKDEKTRLIGAKPCSLIEDTKQSGPKCDLWSHSSWVSACHLLSSLSDLKVKMQIVKSNSLGFEE